MEQKEDEEEFGLEDSFEGSSAPERTAGVLRLIQVRDSSASYAVASVDGQSALGIIAETAQSIASPEDSEWRSGTISSLKELSEIAKSLRCTIEFRRPAEGRKYGDVIAKITPATFEAVAGSAFVTGHTSVYAKIERVGGATQMHCGIRLPNRPRKMVICRVVGEKLVRELGQFMYENVVVSGEATWIRHNWQLKHLVITSFDPPKKSTFEEVFKRVYEAGGDAWDRIPDPDRFIAEMRGQ